MAVFSGNGSNTAPSFTFSSDTNTGMYRAGADELGLATAGAARLFISSNGRFGFGTTAPIAGGLATFSSPIATLAPQLTLVEATSGQSSKWYQQAFTSYLIADGDWHFYPGNSEKVRMASGGNVGIGTTGITPLARLHARRGASQGVSPSVNANVGLFECDFSNGISIIVPDSSASAIFFGSPSSIRFSEITSTTSANLMRMGTRSVGASLSLMSGNASEGARLDSAGRLLVGTTGSTVPVGGQSKGRLTVDASAAGSNCVLTLGSASTGAGTGNHYNVYTRYITKAATTTWTVTLSFPSQSSFYSNSIVRVLFAGGQGTNNTTHVARAEYAVNSFTTVATPTEISDSGSGASMAAVASVSDMVVTITTTANCTAASVYVEVLSGYFLGIPTGMSFG